jgi:hypothetical protein
VICSCIFQGGDEWWDVASTRLITGSCDYFWKWMGKKLKLETEKDHIW